MDFNNDTNEASDEVTSSLRTKDDATLYACSSNCRCISLDFIKSTAENVKKEYERLSVKKLILKASTQRTSNDSTLVNYWVYRCAYIFKQVTIDHILLGKEILSSYEKEVEYDPVGLRKEV
jgi:hypothetical protein